MNTETSVAFRINYLLGVSDVILDQNFKEECKMSNHLQSFDNYCDAPVLRVLNILRKSVILDYNKYISGSVKTLTDLGGTFPRDLQYLKNNNIDISRIYSNYDIVEYVNILTEMINIITYKVLVDLDIPYIEHITKYFYYPIFTKKTLETFVTECNSLNLPNGIPIYNGKNITQSLKYALNNTRNCIYSIFSILNIRVIGKLEINPFIFRKVKGEELDEDAVINVDAILSNRPTKVVEKTEGIAENPFGINSNNENVKIVMQDEKNILKTDQNILIVDCKTMNMFYLLKFLEEKTTKEISKIYLVNTDKEYSIWFMFTKLYKYSIPIEFIEYKNNYLEIDKSSDILLAHCLFSQIYNDNKKALLIASNNKTLINIFEQFKELHFNLITSMELSEVFKKYIVDYNISHIDLSILKDDKDCEKYLLDVLRYLILVSYIKIPLISQSIANVKEYVNSIFNQNEEYTVLVNKNIDNFYELISKDIKISKENGNWIVTSNGYSVSI